MVKVIEQGKQPARAPVQVRCTGCDSLLEFDRREARFVRDTVRGDLLFIDCPACGAEIEGCRSISPVKGATPC